MVEKTTSAPQRRLSKFARPNKTHNQITPMTVGKLLMSFEAERRIAQKGVILTQS